MAARQITRNVELTPQLDRLLRKKVASGRYQSLSEVVREGLRLLEERDRRRDDQVAALRGDIERGWRQAEKGQVLDGREVFEEIRNLSKRRRMPRAKAPTRQ